MSDKNPVPYAAYEKRGRMIAERDAEIARLTNYYTKTKSLLDDANKEIEQLRAALQQIALDTANNTNLESHYAEIARAALD